jgi:hypothetical protein
MSPVSQILAEDNDQIYESTTRIAASDKMTPRLDLSKWSMRLENFLTWSTAPGFRQWVRTDNGLAVCFSPVLRPTVRKPFVYLSQGTFSVVLHSRYDCKDYRPIYWSRFWSRYLASNWIMISSTLTVYYTTRILGIYFSESFVCGVLKRSEPYLSAFGTRQRLHSQYEGEIAN